MINNAMTLLLSLLVFAASPQIGQAGQAGPLLGLQDNMLVMKDNGKTTPLSADEFPVNAVKDANGNPLPGIRYCGVGVDDGQTLGVAPGLYLFDAKGNQAAFAPTEAAEFCYDARLSPGEKVLAMDSGTSLIRSWFFFAYPDMKPLGEVSYYQDENKPALLWEGDEGVFFASLDDAQAQKPKRVCDYDPCGPISTRLYSFKTGEAKTLLAGTSLCDYTLTGFSPERGEVEADKRCLSPIKAWKQFPQNAPVEHITAKVAVQGE